jgi:hypothetical protein
MGMTASSWVMCQLYGTKSAVPRMIMPAMTMKLKLKENQKFLNVLLLQLSVLTDAFRGNGINLRHFNEEVGELQCLCSGTPGHVDLEHVGENRFRNVNGNTPQEDKEQEKPLEVLEQCTNEAAFTVTVSQSGKSDVTAATY